MSRKVVAALAVCLAVVSGGCSRTEPAKEAPPPDMVLITIDTLRADALGFAGQRDVETPFLDRMASESVVFTNAHAHNVVTLPSHVNILTGLYPYQHGVRDNAGYTLDPKFQTVAPLLKARGYATAAFVGAFPLDARYGLTPGFDVYDDSYPEGKGRLDFKVAERSAGEVLAAAAKWWSSARSPRFLWVHVYDPHAPYAPPAPFSEKYAGRSYLGEVAYVDAMLAQHIGPLLRPETTLVITADHGESLGEHGELTHGLFAYEATLKVPLLIRNRGTNARSDGRAVRHIDIAPTLLASAGVDVPAEWKGQSLLADRPVAAPSYFESLSASLNRGWAPLVGVIDQGHKYIDLPLPELYDLGADRGETTNLFSERRRVTTQLRGILAAAAPQKPGEARSVSPDQTAQLLSLGYLAGASIQKKSFGPADDPKNLIAIDGKLHRMIEQYQMGQQQQAIATATEVVRLQPEMSVAREMLAFMLQQSDRAQAGIETLQQAVKQGTATESAKIRLGMILSETGRAREAVEILSPFAAKNDVEVLNAYGIALADVGRSDEAMRQFEKVLSIDRSNATAHQNRGIVELRRGNVDRAEQSLQAALAIDPGMPLALNTLGVVYARTGRTDQAIENWRKAVALDPRLYDALFNLAVVSGQKGRWDVAHGALTQFIQSAPRAKYSRELTAARQMLKEVEQQRSPT